MRKKLLFRMKEKMFLVSVAEWYHFDAAPDPASVRLHDAAPDPASER
jgi:hypothetical protein